MGNIVLGAVTLTRILRYLVRDVSTIAKKKVPAKGTPTVDTDVKVLMPTGFMITARVSTADKVILHGYKATSKTLTDDEGDVTVWVENVESEYQVGYALPWKITITCTQTAY